MNTIAQGLKAFIEVELLQGQSIGVSDDLLMTGQIDSLGVVSLLKAIEQIAGIAVPPQDVTVENFVSIDAMTAYLVRAGAGDRKQEGAENA